MDRRSIGARDRAMTHNQPQPLRARVGALLLSALLLGLVGAVQATGVGDFVVDSSKAAALGNCVEPTEYMRRNHMEVIKHQRDTTVYGGIRSTKHSLLGCVGCHAGHDENNAPIAINEHGQFCAACHDYAAVKVNCFDCHATIPKGEGWNQETAAAHQQLVPGARPPRTAGVGFAAPAEGEHQ
jgi:hypothetical protein